MNEPLDEQAIAEIEERARKAPDGAEGWRVPALCQTVRAAWTMLDLGRQNAPHTEDTGEVCTEDCEGCRNPVAALVYDRNAARGLAYQRGLELDKLQTQLESTESLNAALREQLAENARRHFDDARSLERQRDELLSRLAQVEKERDGYKRQLDSEYKRHGGAGFRP